MSAVILKGDCLEMMKGLADKSIDCFICDLPYGQLSTDDKPALQSTNCKWDVKIDLKQFWEQVERLAKTDNTPVIHFCNTRFGIELINSKPNWFRYDLVWDKGRGISFLLANKMPMKSHEMIYVFSKKGCYYKRIDMKTDKGSYVAWGGGNVYNRQYGVSNEKNFNELGKDGMRCPLSVLNISHSRVRDGHPTEKPREIYEWLLSRYCPDGGTVLDPTAGSFNSIKVARELGLNGIGIEMDEVYYKKAEAYFNQVI